MTLTNVRGYAQPVGDTCQVLGLAVLSAWSPCLPGLTH